VKILRAASVLSLIGLTAAAPARADPPPAEAPDADVRARLAFIERTLDREESSTRLFRGGWLAFFGGATLAQGALIATASASSDRVVSGVGAAKAAVAFAFLLASPATVASSATTLRGAPSATPADRAAKLRLAESLLRSASEEERAGRSWFPLVGGALLNLAGAYTVWGATRNSGAGWFGLVSGIAVAQLQFYTRPTAAIRAWETYTRTRDPARLARDPAPPVRFSILPSAGGLALQGWF
jgi:hypothetical protein